MGFKIGDIVAAKTSSQIWNKGDIFTVSQVNKCGCGHIELFFYEIDKRSSCKICGTKENGGWYAHLFEKLVSIKELNKYKKEVTIPELSPIKPKLEPLKVLENI